MKVSIESDQIKIPGLPFTQSNISGTKKKSKCFKRSRAFISLFVNIKKYNIYLNHFLNLFSSHFDWSTKKSSSHRSIVQTFSGTVNGALYCRVSKASASLSFTNFIVDGSKSNDRLNLIAMFPR